MHKVHYKNLFVFFAKKKLCVLCGKKIQNHHLSKEIRYIIVTSAEGGFAEFKIEGEQIAV